MSSVYEKQTYVKLKIELLLTWKCGLKLLTKVMNQLQF